MHHLIGPNYPSYTFVQIMKWKSYFFYYYRRWRVYLPFIGNLTLSDKWRGSRSSPMRSLLLFLSNYIKYTSSPWVHPIKYTSSPWVHPIKYTSSPWVHPIKNTSSPWVHPIKYTSSPWVHPIKNDSAI